MYRKLILPVVGALMLLFAVYHVVRANQTPSKAAPLTEPAHSPFRATIAGTGVVEPNTENISIGSHLPGVVERVFVKVGDKVEKGKTVLFRLDDRNLRAEWQARSANLAAAKAQLAKLDAMPRAEEVTPAEARLREAKANLVDLLDQYERIVQVAAGSVSATEVVRREQAKKMADEQVAKAQADLDLIKAGAWKPDLEVARAAVKQSEALVNQTQTELDRLGVVASVDGEVLQMNVRPGEFVGTPPNQALVVLGGVKKHVRVDIDENDIARFREGLPAIAKRRGDADREIPLTFVRVEPLVIPKKSLAGGTQERTDTRVLQVIYAVGRTDAPLYAGQQVDVFLDAEK
jgi:multidrug resistance efflux pump